MFFNLISCDTNPARYLRVSHKVTLKTNDSVTQRFILRIQFTQTNIVKLKENKNFQIFLQAFSFSQSFSSFLFSKIIRNNVRASKGSSFIILVFSFRFPRSL
jgi:hypothetical protein